MEIKQKVPNPKSQIPNLKDRKPDIRYLNDLKDVLYDKKWARKAKNFELYYMYRGIKSKNGLRYDITVIPPAFLGKEFVKTKGHEHLPNYGEIYTVLEGQGIYLMQKMDGNKIKDVYAIKAKKGESVIIPSGYGHVTINSSPEKKLITANWVSENCQGIYNLFIQKQGACYYFTKNGWIKNKNYQEIPKLRFKKPLKSLPRNLEFLKIKG
jgi:glucose-6-phosphate isomerase